MLFKKRVLKNLVIPVEIQVREFDAKLLLSCFAAEKGFKVFIGSKYEINKQTVLLPPAIYIGKALRANGSKVYKLNKRLHNPVAGWDEEGLVYFSPEIYLKRRISSGTLALLEAIFAWGSDNASVINQANYTHTPIHITGNPRGDLLRQELGFFFEKKVNSLKRQYGDYILINSNFAMVNGFLKNFTQLPHPSEGLPAFEKAREVYNPELAVHRHAMFDHFKKLLVFLAANFPNRKIILRPHPSENPEPWQELVKPYPNVTVLIEGNVIPWLKACKVLIHNGCTTALEASLLGTEIIAYSPISSEKYDAHLPNNLSLKTVTLEETKKIIEAIFLGQQPTHEDKSIQEFLNKIKKDHVTSMDGTFASEKIVDVLEQIAKKIKGRNLFSIKYWWACYLSLINKIKRNLRYNDKGGRVNFEVRTNNFPPITLEEVQNRVKLFSTCLNGRFDTIEVKKWIKEGVFELSSSIRQNP